MTKESDPGLDVVLLCGGRGVRAYPDTAEVPKPLLEVGGRPVVEHVMDIYAGQGHTRFLLAGGYRFDLLAERYEVGLPGRSVEVFDTGLDADKGERLRAVAPHCRGERFLVSYADGLGDVDLAALIRFHARCRAAVTVTTVPLPSQYGTLAAEKDGRVTEFLENPVLNDHWINAGFFVFERAALEGSSGDLETDVLPALVRDGSLYAFRHRGFWKSMDTYKDRQALQSLLDSGRAPWLGPAGEETA
ncbi:MAG TPA: sugar phosphate nucleotidyltransferase [Acidimicrobiales bacterium]|nr:sugar phosphate nucleotidyltransferase [Acidimicrobiales bacterium]